MGLASRVPEIDLEDAELNISIAQKYGWTIQMARITNGLGPMRVFDYYQIKIIAEGCPPDRYCVSYEDYKYLINKHKDIQVY